MAAAETFVQRNTMEIGVGILIAAIVIAIVVQAKGGVAACTKILSEAALWGGIAFLVGAFGVHFFKVYKATKPPASIVQAV